MWLNEATQANVAALAGRGIEMIGPVEGALAGPDVGVGRLAETADIIAAADYLLGERTQLAGVKVVVTAGGTREPIDAMRFIGNTSSGQMGFEIAHEAARRGAEVTLITGPTHLVAPAGAETVEADHRRRDAGSGRQGCAGGSRSGDGGRGRRLAPGTYLAGQAEQNPGSAGAGAGAHAGHPGRDRRPAQPGRAADLTVLVGFCAETGDLEEAARSKLSGKSLDLVVANRVGAADSGAGVNTLRALIFDKEGRLSDVGLVPKRKLASVILNRVAERLA